MPCTTVCLLVDIWRLPTTNVVFALQCASVGFIPPSHSRPPCGSFKPPIARVRGNFFLPPDGMFSCVACARVFGCICVVVEWLWRASNLVVFVAIALTPSSRSFSPVVPVLVFCVLPLLIVVFPSPTVPCYPSLPAHSIPCRSSSSATILVVCHALPHGQVGQLVVVCFSGFSVFFVLACFFLFCFFLSALLSTLHPSFPWSFPWSFPASTPLPRYLLARPDMRQTVQKIFRATPKDKQVLMFSATISEATRKVCLKFTQNVRMPPVADLVVLLCVCACVRVYVCVCVCVCVCI
jgi:hypothetical protein